MDALRWETWISLQEKAMKYANTKILTNSPFEHSQTIYHNTHSYSMEKMGKCPFQKKKKKIQHFVPFPKLIREMLIFWNSIFSKSS